MKKHEIELNLHFNLLGKNLANHLGEVYFDHIQTQQLKPSNLPDSKKVALI